VTRNGSVNGSVEQMTADGTPPSPPSTEGAAAATPVPGGARRFTTRALILGIVFGLLLGFGVGAIGRQFNQPRDGSVEAGFARDMSSHHAQAVELAMLAHEKGSDPEVRQVGADIAMTQQAQIGMMQTWLGDWNLSPNSTRPRMAWMPDGGGQLRDGLMPGMATDAERAQLRAATGRDFDLLFVRLMIQHHLGGIHMAEAAVAEASDPDVKWLAQTMVDGQQREITDLRTLETRLAG
jgi:uncharacterized protein (DUF305 family)